MNHPSNTTTYQALQRASQLLDTSAALAAETDDANQKVCRALNQAVALLTDTSRSLVEDSLGHMESQR